MFRFKTIVFLAVIALASSAMASDSGFVGKWKLNVKKSDFGKNPAPKSAMLTISADTPTSLKWSYKEVGADGKTISDTFSGAADGKQYPVNGDPNIASGAFTGKGNEVNVTWKMKDGSTSTEHTVLNGDTMTATVTDQSGGKVTDVWERVGGSAGKAAAKKSTKK